VSVHWVIEQGVFSEAADRVIAALDGRGLPWSRYADGVEGARLPPAGSCALFWGSLGVAYGDDSVARRWRPGAIGDIARFACSAYYPPLRPLLANASCVLTTVRRLVNDARGELRSLGDPESVFIRPDSALKPFSGRVLEVGAINLAALDHGFYYDDEDLPILVSQRRTIGREWRFVIADCSVVTACEYEASRRGLPGVVPDSALALASQVAANEWQAAEAFVLDVGEVDGEPRVMELNPLSGADLYTCDAPAVVAAVTAIAQRLCEGAVG